MGNITAIKRAYIEEVVADYPFMKDLLQTEYEQIKAGNVDGKNALSLFFMEKQIKAVEETIKSLKPMDLYVFQRLYLDRCKDRMQIISEISTSPETYTRAKRRIIEEAGRRLGVLF